MNNYNQSEIDLYRAEQAIRASAHHQSREIITHYETVTVGIKIPLLQSIITAFLLSLLICVSTYALKWDWWKIGGISFVVILALDWIRRSEAWRRSVWELEGLLHLDLNRDGIISEPVIEPVREEVRITVDTSDGKQTQFIDFPVSRAKLSEMASGVCSGQALSEASMSGAGALFSRSEYNQIRDTMIKRDWLVWNNPEHRTMRGTIKNHK